MHVAWFPRPEAYCHYIISFQVLPPPCFLKFMFDQSPAYLLILYGKIWIVTTLGKDCWLGSPIEDDDKEVPSLSPPPSFLPPLVPLLLPLPPFLFPSLHFSKHLLPKFRSSQWFQFCFNLLSKLLIRQHLEWLEFRMAGFGSLCL